MTLNIALDLLFMNIVRPPVAGIALATSAVLLAMSIVLFRTVSRACLPLDWRPLASFLMKITGISALMGAAVFVLAKIAELCHFSDMVLIPVSAIAAFITFFGLSLLFRLDEPYSLLKLLRREPSVSVSGLEDRSNGASGNV